MSYHGLGLELPGLNLPGIPGVVAAPQTTTTQERAPTAPTARDAEIAAKVAARDQERERSREVEELKRSDVNLPGQEFVEDWTPVPETEVVVVEEQKVPWLMIGIGGAAVLGLGYFIWSR